MNGLLLPNGMLPQNGLLLQNESAPKISRRALLGSSAGLIGAGLLGWRLSPGNQPAARAASEPRSGLTWLLPSPGAVRPEPPASPSADEISELLRLQRGRTRAQLDAAYRWGRGPAPLPWTDVALELIVRHRPSPPRAARALALLHTAMSDAITAADDARQAYPRPAPASSIGGLAALSGLGTEASSFPSVHAAVATAAAGTLATLFPDEPGSALEALAAEAAESRVVAGLAYRSDVVAGQAIGRAVAALAVARASADGADATWDGVRPEGEGTWQPTPPDYRAEPVDPMAGTWRTWLVPDVIAARPASPPAWGSAAWEAQIGAVQEAVARRTPDQEDAVHRWAGGPGTVTPAGLWIEIARDLIKRDGLDDADAAHVLATTSVALADAFICCWDTKYAYWYARPVTADPGLNVLIPTPPFPSYTSGHSTISAAAAAVLGHHFPADQSWLQEQAFEAKQSRLWAGIHYPIDNDVGAAMGDVVGQLTVKVART
jgi:membrane-associated phospholipid phosphatase